MAFTPPAVDEIDESQPKFTPPAPDAFDPLQNVKLSDYEKYRIAIAQGATPENYAELPSVQTPFTNPDYDFPRQAGAVPFVLPAIDKAIELAGEGAVKVADLPTKLRNKLHDAEDPENPFHTPTLEERTSGGQNIITIPHAPSMEGQGTIPQVAEGIANLAADTATSLIGRPQSAFLLPLMGGEGAVGKLASTAFGASTAAHIPEGVAKAVDVISDPNASLAEKTAAIGNPLVQTALSATMFNHGLTEGGPRASSITSPEGIPIPEVRQPMGEEAPLRQQGEAAPTQASTAPKAKVPLSGEYRALLEPHWDENTHVTGTLGRGEVAVADHATGKVIVDPEEFKAFVDNDLKGMSPKEKAAAVATMFDEENIHLKTDPEEADKYEASLSPFEKRIFTRNYLRGNVMELSPRNLGFEVIRKRVQQARGMTPSEFIGLALKERWTAKSLDALAEAVGKIRRLRDKELNDRQKAILDKVLDNIGAARAAVPAQTKEDQREYVEGPFALRQDDEPGGEVPPFLKKGPGETTVSEFMNLSDEDAQKFFDGNIKRGNPIQNDAVLAGMKMGVDKIPELTKLRDEMHQEAMRKMQAGVDSGKLEMPVEFGKVIWLNGALEGAARKGPNYESVVTRRRAAEGPAALRRDSEKEGRGTPDLFGPMAKTGPATTQPFERNISDFAPTTRDLIKRQQEFLLSDRADELSPKELKEQKQKLRDLMQQYEDEQEKPYNVQGPAALRKVDWNDLDSVKDYAEKLGPGMVVIKHPDRNNYNITHASRTDLYDPSWVVHETGGQKSFPAALRKKGKPGEQEEMFGTVTQKGVPGGEDVQPTSAGQAGAGAFPTEQKVFAKDLTFSPKDYGAGSLPVRPITASEAKNAAELSKFLTKDARKEGSALPVSMSKRLTVLFDKTDGSVHLVSTYRGDNVARMVDPEIAGKERNSRPVSELLHRYEPVASVLLAEPRQGFHQKFDSMADFQEKFGKEASEMMREQSTGTEGIPQTRMSQTPIREPEQVERGIHPSEPFQFPKEQREPNLRRPEESELRAFHDFFGDTPPSDALMFSRRIEARAATASRAMINGLRKLVRIESAQTRGLSEGEALGRVFDKLYENYRNSDTRSDFVQRTLDQVRVGHPEEVPAGGAPRTTGARELSTLRSRGPTAGELPAPEVVARGEGFEVQRPRQAPKPQLPPPQSPEMLTPEQRALLEKRIDQEHNILSPERSQELLKSLTTSKAPEQRYTMGRSKSIQGETPSLEERPPELQSEIFPSREMESEAPPEPKSKEELASEKKAVAKGEGNKGQLDFWKRQGPAMLRKVEDTAEKVKDYLARTGANVKSAGDLSDQLYRLKTSEKADYDLALPVIKSALKIIPEADRPVLLKYADEMQVLKKSDIKLTDAQEAMYETFLKPLLEDNQKMYKSLMRAGVPVGESTYLGRMVQDTHSLYNRLWQGTKQRIAEGSLLGQGASFFKRRVFKALEAPDGTRRLIALVGDGKDTRVIGYEKGKAELLGKMPPESLEPKPLTPQQIRTQRLVEARRLQALDKLDKEEFALLKEKDRLSKDPKADPAILKEIDDRLASINGDYAEVGEKYPSPVFDVPRMWKDKDGKLWKFTDATIGEIEGNTNTRYYQEPMSGVITQNLKLKQIYRANVFLEGLKNSPDFQRISRSVNERNVPEDWRTVDLPQFRGLRIEPRTADVLDLFSQEQRGPSLPMKYVSQLTGFLRNALFVWNPFVHEPNLLAHWFTARGIEWGKPMGYDRMLKSGVAALNDVLTRSRFRDQALRAGAPLMRGMGQISKQVLTLLRKELDPNPSVATKIARGLGYINPLRMIRAFGDSLTWGTNEVLTLQLIRETMARTGLSLEDAISEVGKHMPNYRIPTRVLNSRLIAHVMRNPLMTLWGHYHYGALRSYGEMGKEIFSPSSTMKTRIEGLGRVATIGFLMALAYPAIDDIVNKVLKTKGLKIRRAGSTTFPQGVMDVARGKKTPEALVQSVLTPSPVTQGAFELAFNRNLRSGLPVYERRLGTDTLKDLGSFAANKISPVEEAGRVMGGKKSAQEFGLGLAGITRTRADSAMSRFGRMADDWMRTNSDESIREEYKRRTQDVFQESDYQLLRSAIIRQDDRAAQMAVNKLLKTRKPEEVDRRIKQWKDSPFTGTRKTDKALMEEMTPKDWDLWYQAAQERLDIADGMRNALVDALVKPQ